MRESEPNPEELYYPELDDYLRQHTRGSLLRLVICLAIALLFFVVANAAHSEEYSGWWLALSVPLFTVPGFFVAAMIVASLAYLFDVGFRKWGQEEVLAVASTMLRYFVIKELIGVRLPLDTRPR